MDPSRRDQDDEIIRLLGKLKNAGPEYPARLYEHRRAAVLAGLIALPIAGMAALGWFARLVNLVKSMAVIDKIVLGVELVAVAGLTTYGAATAYIYRDELQAMLFPSTVVVSTPFPSLSVPVASPVPSLEGTATPIPSVTSTGTLLATQTSALVDTQNNGTPQPQAGDGTPGLHLGQTKTPKDPTPRGKP